MTGSERLQNLLKGRKVKIAKTCCIVVSDSRAHPLPERYNSMDCHGCSFVVICKSIEELKAAEK